MADEQALLEQARRFDRRALGQVYDLYSTGIYQYAMRLLGDPATAEDCVAETFSRFLQALRRGKGPRDFLRAYLYRTAHNWIVDRYRRQPPAPVELTELVPDEGPGPEQQTGERLRDRRLRAALRQLTQVQQQVIALKFLEGWENEEIARALGKPVGAVKSLQHRALASLQRLLENEVDI